MSLKTMPSPELKKACIVGVLHDVIEPCPHCKCRNVQVKTKYHNIFSDGKAWVQCSCGARGPLAIERRQPDQYFEECDTREPMHSIRSRAVGLWNRREP